MNIDNIIEDLRQFADPYSEVTAVSGPDGHTVSWLSRRREMVATFRAEGTGVVVDFRNARLSYAAFLAHEDLGALTFLAENILRQFRSLRRIPTAIETLATRGEAAARPAHLMIHDAVRSHADDGTTHVVFLAAQGGAGKTRVLERLALEGAEAFIEGASQFLYFYVNAQGRALAQVDEAFAVELDLLGAHLSFSAIAALARVGALVPIIDGFDELIGAVGYDEAFQSLGRFLDALRGSGQLIAAARSTYYEREFQARVRLRPQRDRWSLDTVTLQPWGADQRMAAVDMVLEERTRGHEATDDDAVQQARERLGTQAEALGSLLGRPFFAVQAARALLAGESIQEDGDLLRSLTEALLRREVSEKFLDRNHQSMATLSQVWAFTREVAAELWYQQTRSLDGPSVEGVIAVATEGWQPLAIDRLRERVRDLPVFAATEGGRVEFGHEYFFGLFLAEIIRAAVATGGFKLEDSLGRGLLPEGVAHQVGLDVPDLSAFFGALNTATAAEALRSALIRENAGTLAAEALSAHQGHLRPLAVRRMTFGYVALAGDVERLDCHDCFFRRTDMSRLRVGAGDWQTSQFELPAVRPSTTVLKVTGLVVGLNLRGLRVMRDSGSDDIWEPAKVTAALRELQATLPVEAPHREVDDATVQVVQKLARAFLKSVFVASDDDVNANFMRSPAWPRVLAALVSNHLVLPEQRSASGRPKVFYRCQANPDDLMAGLSPSARVDAKVKAFWDELAAHPAAN